MLLICRWQDRLTEMLPEFRDLAGIDGIDFGYALARYLYDAAEEEAAASCYAAIVERLRLPPRRDMMAGAQLSNLAYLTARLGDGDRPASIYELLLPFGDAFPPRRLQSLLERGCVGLSSAGRTRADKR
jgi:hypothetical protein